MHKRRSDLAIMGSLTGLVKPLTLIMLTGILLGVLGFLCAIFITILGGYGVIQGLAAVAGSEVPGQFTALFGGSSKQLFTAILVFAILRGVLHYGEQYCNHYIAFRILAIIRHKVFAVLRKLCPAKLEGRDKGNLIAVITSDIELLEVFFAHTISPIAIAVLTSLIMVGFIGAQHRLAGVLAVLAYVTVGIGLPIRNGRRSAKAGMALRSEMGELNHFVLESLYGVDELLQFNRGEAKLAEMEQRSERLAGFQKKLSGFEGSQRALTNLVIQLYSFGMLFLMLFLYRRGEATFSGMLLATLAMMGSFGPVVALSSLSNHLNQTLACGERVLSLLEETPEVAERSDGERPRFEGAEFDRVSFAYLEEKILSEFSLQIERGKVLGIHGASGSGKSTLLKLLMRFWDVQKGAVRISGEDVRDIQTAALREMTSYVTQDTVLFHDTIAKNIAVAKLDATQAEIEAAAAKASIHDFIMSLPKGYETELGELGDRLSGGEKQRIGLARAFLHEADFILLDEPTSNLDVLNEGIILKSLSAEKEGKTIVLVSHRQSTMSIADFRYHMDNGRVS